MPDVVVLNVFSPFPFLVMVPIDDRSDTRTFCHSDRLPRLFNMITKNPSSLLTHLLVEQIMILHPNDLASVPPQCKYLNDKKKRLFKQRQVQIWERQEQQLL